MRLYWTTAHRLTDIKRSESYSVDTLALPPLFWDDLKQVLGMLAQSRLALIREKFTGHYVADKLLPLIEQVRRLLEVRPGTWTSEFEIRACGSLWLTPSKITEAKEVAMRPCLKASLLTGRC